MYQNYGYYNPQYQNPYLQNQQNSYPSQYMNQYQNQYQNQQQFQQNVINGKVVDSIEVVKAKDVDLSGNPSWYPKADGTEIYRKQLMADGTSQTLIYKLETPCTVDGNNANSNLNIENVENMLSSFKNEILAEIRSITNVVENVTNQTETTKRGASKL